MTAIRPELYGLMLVAGIGAGQMLAVQGTPIAGLSAFCIDTADGRRHVVLNNMSDSAVPSVSVDLACAGSTATALLLAGDALLSPRCTLGGATLDPGTPGQVATHEVRGSGGVFKVSLPAASALHLSSALFR